jgi:hypothetical protein
VYPAFCALLPLIVCTLAVGPPPCPHDCSYYNAEPGCCNSNFLCLKNGQLYGKALGPGFVSLYGPTQCFGKADQWVCWPQEGTKGENKKQKKLQKQKLKYWLT